MMSLSIGLMASCVTSAGRRVGSRRACSTSRLSGRNKGRARASCLAKGFPGAKGNGGDLDTAAALLYRPLLRQPGSCHLAEGTEDHLPRGRRGGGGGGASFEFYLLRNIFCVSGQGKHNARKYF